MKLLRANTHIRFFNKREDEKKIINRNIFSLSFLLHRS
jgi:hypothetical protein